MPGSLLLCRVSYLDVGTTISTTSTVRVLYQNAYFLIRLLPGRTRQSVQITGTSLFRIFVPIGWYCSIGQRPDIITIVHTIPDTTSLVSSYRIHSLKFLADSRLQFQQDAPCNCFVRHVPNLPSPISPTWPARFFTSTPSKPT